ncbi:MAG: hypothetical protein GF417_10985 [Candidatus Latescibacteria bacterium]|nr:hypothetical protein [bacterium]MBD3424950.1 hypothetical protein [Candidatus Latescibacterota bacterium]
MYRRVSILIVVISTLVLQGCLFETRDPVVPGGGEEDTWVPVEEATDVFTNLSSGFSELANSNYERSLSDEFLFVPTGTDQGQYPGILDDWDKSDELDFLNKIKGDYTGERSIRFGDESGEFDQVNLEGDEPWVEGEYLITLEGEASYGGIARFTFVRAGQPKYQLKEWRDIDFLGDYSTSGSLRGQNPPGQ